MKNLLGWDDVYGWNRHTGTWFTKDHWTVRKKQAGTSCPWKVYVIGQLVYQATSLQRAFAYVAMSEDRQDKPVKIVDLEEL
jgi:hypothetical protein